MPQPSRHPPPPEPPRKSRSPVGKASWAEAAWTEPSSGSGSGAWSWLQGDDLQPEASSSSASWAWSDAWAETAAAEADRPLEPAAVDWTKAAVDWGQSDPHWADADVSMQDVCGAGQAAVHEPSVVAAGPIAADADRHLEPPAVAATAVVQSADDEPEEDILFHPGSLMHLLGPVPVEAAEPAAIREDHPDALLLAVLDNYIALNDDAAWTL